ncbi:Protein of uncharacterised function (DUF1116) [Leminorella richardii]|uniref:Protein of uncharacterized function (DUF1116) n=1 Tax=Leminorella richardii TaxID=158841 RepID=A0A2X4USS1_9GAMM|nr:DUF1116 domain-containing protein [Leminorella richardii]SQI42887.1 Protein of uncharacterised function (DUF1116) [Leminorella richardii]
MYASIQEANAAVIERIKEARPHWLDVKPAKQVIPVLQEGRRLLHAGPPVTWQAMSGPVRGACISACLFEGWAKTKEEALSLLDGGGVEFFPCHSVDAVGPMGGITSANMPMLVIENKVHGNRAYCNLNEGIGKVMRFGAYNEEVQARLRWMRDTLAPTLSEALQAIEGGIDLTAVMAQAITMGDEFHQRNIAASALLMRVLAPKITLLKREKDQLAEVMQFLSVTDQFFLNLAMAYCKAAMDAGAQIEAGSIVTVMTRNGENFGIRVSGMGDRWFTAPVNTPEGLFFTGYSQADANPDIGDSAITETFGVGGAAMVAAPGVTRFVGAGGGISAALEVTEEMGEIYLERNGMMQIPTWDFQGACIGLDVLRVVETGITPLINTGIAHREAGVGQIGAGTVRAPLACFEKALEALAEKMDIKA